MNQQYQYQQQLAYERRQRQIAESDSVVNGLAAANSDLENAKTAYIQARQMNDLSGEADAQERISDARHRINTLAGGKEAMDEEQAQQEQYQQNYQQQQPQRQYTAMDIINSMTRLTPKEREWLIDHQDLVTSQEGQTRLQGAYLDSQAMGIDRDSDAYFDLFNDRFGNGHQGSVHTLTSPPQQYVVGGPQVQEQYKSPSNTYTPQTAKVSLTRQEAAKIAGVDMETYRRGERELAERKRLGMYSDR